MFDGISDDDLDDLDRKYQRIEMNDELDRAMRAAVEANEGTLYITRNGLYVLGGLIGLCLLLWAFAGYGLFKLVQAIA